MEKKGKRRKYGVFFEKNLCWSSFTHLFLSYHDNHSIVGASIVYIAGEISYVGRQGLGTYNLGSIWFFG